MRIAHHAVRTLAKPIILGALRLYDPNPRAMLRNKEDSSVEHLWSSIPRQIQLSCLGSGKRCISLQHLSDFIRFCFVSLKIMTEVKPLMTILMR